MFCLNYNTLLSQAPPSPPPRISPQYSSALKNCGPVVLRQNIRLCIYVWTTFGNSFWMYPVDVNNKVVFCYAWDGASWQYILFSTSLIDSIF